MSWDLYLIEDDKEVWWANYTHNTNPMIRAASVSPKELGTQPSIAGEVLFHQKTLGTCWSDISGRPASDAGAFAGDIWRELERDPQKYDSMNPPNGWGSRASVVELLKEVEQACDLHPLAVFKANG